jgi:osmotically-inducible protein OsmY
MTSRGRRQAGAMLVAGLLASALPGCAPVVLGRKRGETTVPPERRAEGVSLQDEAVERIAPELIEERFPKDVHVNVSSFNRIALLTGEVPGQNERDAIAALVQSIEGVRQVFNELVVAPVSTLTARAVDRYLTARVKTRFLDAGRFRAVHVRVLTEAGIVYLMGLVTPQEAQDAADLAARTPDVKSVARVFELMDASASPGK